MKRRRSAPSFIFLNQNLKKTDRSHPAPFIRLVRKLGPGKIASICPAERSSETQAFWVYGEAFERSYSGQRRSKIAAHELPNKSIC
jgi:hypothetical protein